MKITNFKIKLLAFVFVLLFFWQILKLWSFYHEKVSSSRLDVKIRTQKVLVSVYYEALCSDSRSFIVRQLLPTFKKIDQYVDIKLVPYGKAETIVTNDDYMFNCQHGKVECQANIIHACTIHKIKDLRKQLDAIVCMIKNNMHPLSILKTCVGEMEEYREILDCSVSVEGRKYLMEYGEATSELNPKVNFIPTITLDNDRDVQVLILKNLLHQVCLRIKNPPPECKNEN